MLETLLCPSCGVQLPSDASVRGLCPQCLLGLALEPVAEEFGSADELETLVKRPVTGVASGQILGDRYQIRSLLGQGGMGDVWHAYDLKLKVEVALKSLRVEMLADEIGLELLRREVRSAREVVSPHVCRVFDLVTEDQQELVSMEYIDGTTLLDIMMARGPLEVREASEIAAQFLAGLEAIHQAGLVHRDLKPENIMITRTGRVVVMDLGIAKGHSDQATGTISGTPAYMAPEQARGESVDARADIYSAGIVLAEMVSSDGVRNEQNRRGLWQALREDPKSLPEGPWKPILGRALAWQPEDRYPSARALSRALEEITLRVGGVDDRCPYPGLAAFTADDAEYFFGREQEVETLWKKLGRPHLLAVIGASGAGKSSFLRAGVLPAKPEGWSCILSTPGTRPFTSLAETFAAQMAGDAEAVRDLLHFDDLDVAVSIARRWRQRHHQALVVIDQFEELFTLNPEETQVRYADLLGRLVLEADIHVLLSMRDDFLMHCRHHDSLAPIFSELTPLIPPSGDSLRRALSQPALLCGFRFEDDALLDDMLGEVSGERGTLPLLAFAAAALWERRDRERGLLTRKAYKEIGGVAGALAQHAEATLERIGAARLPVVREIFRNLVTAEGTRAVLDIDELLSVFDQPDEATKVLQELIDARLLISFEKTSDVDGLGTGHRVEIIHESLLEAWPRLVRWRTQEADQVQLRDQLRQAAQLWTERGRPADLLWSGTSFKEFELWRERYAGGLTETEAVYADAMQVHAARRQRRRRMAVAATFAFLVGVVVIISALWVQSRRSEREAIAQAARAEASKLFALGQLQAEHHPTAALAHAIKSLEQADTPEVRRFAMEMLWRGPTAFVVGTTEEIPPLLALFSPDGRWLLESGLNGRLRLWENNGTEPRFLDGHEMSFVLGWFSPDSQRIVSHGLKTSRIWTLPDATESWRLERDYAFADMLDNRIIAWSPVEESRNGIQRRLIRTWPLSGGDPETVGVYQIATPIQFDGFQLDQTTDRLYYNSAGALYELDLTTDESAPPRQVISGADPVLAYYSRPQGDYLTTAHVSGALKIWTRPADSEDLVADRAFRGDPQNPSNFMSLDSTGKWLAAGKSWSGSIDLWNLEAAAGSEPVVLRRGGVSRIQSAVFNPVTSWLATLDQLALTLWPVGREYPRVFSVPGEDFREVVFDPDGEWVAASSSDDAGASIWIWDLSPTGRPGRKILQDRCAIGVIRLDGSPDGESLVASSACGPPRVIPVSGGPDRELEGFVETPGGNSWVAIYDAYGNRIAAAGNRGPDKARIGIWDLVTGELQVLDPDNSWPVVSLDFTPDGDLLAGTIGSGLYRWDLASGVSELLLEGNIAGVQVSPDGRHVLVARSNQPNLPVGEILVYDLDQKTYDILESHGDEVSVPIWSPAGDQIISPSLDGSIRVGPFSGEEPHLLTGHEEMVWGVDVDRSGRWIASASDDGTVRLWPMPEGQPLNALPHDELLGRLKSLTNYRMVEDVESSTGYRLDYEPFGGWNRELPTW